MPEPLFIPFGELKPDMPAFRSDGLMTALNVVPRTNSYSPFRRLAAISTNTLTERCLGAITARDVNDNIYVYAGDENRLYELTNNAFAEESSSAAVYSTGTNDVWEFIVWAQNNVIIATNYADAIQSMTLGGGASGAFANMITSTNRPRAKHIGVVNSFVVLGNTYDTTDGVKSSRVWWGGIRDETDFDPSAATQCDYEDLATGGVVHKIVGGTEYGLIFQERMVRTMRYVGGGVVFELLPINYVPGCALPNSVIAHHGQVFYISDVGFMGMAGVNAQPIGNNRIDRDFWSEFDVSDRRYVSSAIDPVNKIVAWAYPNSSASTNLPNRIIMCKYDELKWAHAEVDTEILLSSEDQGYTLDSLDDVSTDIDNASAFDESLDSNKWKGGTFRFGAFDQSHRLSFFTGATLGATLDTGDIQPTNGRHWQVNGARPLVDGSDARVSVATRERLKDSVSYGPSADLNVSGNCKVRSHGRYQRFRLSLSSCTSWSHVQGLELDYSMRGRR